MKHRDSTRLGRFVNDIEENVIALILALMTVITFVNVVERYVFNNNILWAYEGTSFLFAWLVLIGASHGVKTGGHLGVDALLNVVSPSVRRALGIICALICVLYGFLLLKGAWDYFAPFAELQKTSGHWFPTGFEKTRGQGWYEVNDVPMPAFMNQFFADIFNFGEPYEKMPRLIPYVILPISMALLLFRFVQALYRMCMGEIDMMISSHEAEDAVEEAAAANAADEAASQGDQVTSDSANINKRNEG